MRAILTYRRSALLFGLCAVAASGCRSLANTDSAQMASAQQRQLAQNQTMGVEKFEGSLPRELDMVTMAEYIIEPPDVLRIDAIRLIPPSPYRVDTLDSLFIQVPDLPAEDAVNGLYVVNADGSIALGASCGPPLRVLGMSLEQVKAAVDEQLKKTRHPNAKASVALGQSRTLQQIRGEHQVRPDGTVGLGEYGSLRVVGLTLVQAKQAIENHLSKFLQRPEVTVDVASSGSKVYYVIYEGTAGQQAVVQPITGNDTVLKAIAQVKGLPPISSSFRMWIARPAPVEVGRELIMPVDWAGITRGQTKTNYQLLPGDRLHISANGASATTANRSLFRTPFAR